MRAVLLTAAAVLVFSLACAVGAQDSTPAAGAAVQPIQVQGPIVRIKDVARVQGSRDNQLFGLGLVVGLDGTGDSAGARANVQMIANMLDTFGITVNADELRVRNIAAVMVTADIPSSVRGGDRIDVTVSSIGDARSLQGGLLLQTPLQAGNGEVYAAAQGSLSIGGFNVRGGSGAGQLNHAVVAQVPGGAIIERDLQGTFSDGETLSLVLMQPDFTTAARLASVVNQVYGAGTALAEDQATVRVSIPDGQRRGIVSFIAELEKLPVRPDVQARVVINERTGTVVMGSSVRVAAVAVAHGSLSVRVAPTASAAALPDENAETNEFVFDQPEQTGQTEQVMLLDGGSSVQELVDALNAIGAAPRDIIAILQAIKAAGALFGELILL